jgi:hypothetical protein
MRTACGVAGWRGLATLAGKATDAERLELEAHLATCARCAEDHAMLALVRRLRDPEAEGLGGAAHERIRNAMSGYEVRPHRPARKVSWPLGVGAVLALGAAAVVLGPLRHARPGDSSVARNSSPIVAGDVLVTEEREGVATMRSERGGRVQLDDVSAELAPGTELGWNRTQHELALHRGGVTVDRPDGAKGHVEIRIARFRVEIAGARFTADNRSVRAERGHLQVVRADGVITELSEGETWREDDHEQPAPPVPAAARPEASAAPSLRPTSTTSPRRVQSGASAGAEVAAAHRLALARQALGRGDAAGARGDVEPLFRLDGPVAAEARVLYAESFLIEGRYADAIEAYRVVTRDFPGASQAESALFAVAQLESEHGRAADAVGAFRRYLDRYPGGRFAREASERIARLAPAGP